MNDRRKRSMAAAFALASLGAWAFEACGGISSEQLCEKACSCRGCSQKEREDCVSEGDILQKKADDVGCGSEYRDYLSCVDQYMTCKNGSKVDVSACEKEAKDFATCAKGSKSSTLGVPIGDACVQATDHLSECLDISTDPSGGEQASCTGSALCSAACINAASCDEIKDAYTGMSTDASQPLIDCLTSCSDGSTGGAE